ncbi:MAG: hypothetical protein ACJ74Y_11740 [Bryobacteraceae bacterium]
MTALVTAPQPQPFRRPLVFEPKRAQAPAEAKWLARGPGYHIFFTRDGVTMIVDETTPEPSDREPRYSTVRMKLAGSRPWDDLTGLAPTGGVSNYFVRKDAKAWRTNIPHYNRISAGAVYAASTWPSTETAPISSTISSSNQEPTQRQFGSR